VTDIAEVFLPESLAAYAQWFQTHPNGYIINAHKTGALPMVWHRVGCGHIEPDGVTKFIGGDYLKACTDDPGELALWAKARKESLHYCTDCRAAGSKSS
jgi:hypothetical protein